LSPYDETDVLVKYKGWPEKIQRVASGRKYDSYMNPDYKREANAFLEKRLEEYDKKIIKMKRKRKAVKVAFVFCISLSIVSSTVCATLTVLIPPVAISVLTASGALAAAVSLTFNLKDKNRS